MQLLNQINTMINWTLLLGKKIGSLKCLRAIHINAIRNNLSLEQLYSVHAYYYPRRHFVQCLPAQIDFDIVYSVMSRCGKHKYIGNVIG